MGVVRLSEKQSEVEHECGRFLLASAFDQGVSFARTWRTILICLQPIGKVKHTSECSALRLVRSPLVINDLNWWLLFRLF